MRKLERSSLEAYAGLVVALLFFLVDHLGLPLREWIVWVVWLTIAGLLLDALWRARLRWRKTTRFITSLVLLTVLAWFCWKSVARYREIQRGGEVRLDFVYPTSPAVMLVNPSEFVVREIRYWLVIWNLDSPAWNAPRDDGVDPLPVPTASADWISPHGGVGPRGIFTLPTVRSLLKPGDRLFGSAGVACASCRDHHTYWFYAVYGKDGWYAPTKQPINHIKLAINMEAIRRDLQTFITKEAPPEKRIPIRAFP